MVVKLVGACVARLLGDPTHGSYSRELRARGEQRKKEEKNLQRFALRGVWGKEVADCPAGDLSYLLHPSLSLFSSLSSFSLFFFSLRRLPGRPSPLYTRCPGLRRRRAATRYAYPSVLFASFAYPSSLTFLLCETELPNPSLSYLPIPIRI